MPAGPNHGTAATTITSTSIPGRQKSLVPNSIVIFEQTHVGYPGLVADIAFEYGCPDPGRSTRRPSSLEISVVITLSITRPRTSLLHDPNRHAGSRWPSLGRPCGGHITGTVNMNPELSAKRLQILREMIHSVRRVSVLVDVNDPASREPLTQTRSATQTLGLTLNVLDMRSDADLQSALSTLLRESQDPVVVLPTSLFLARRQQLADFFLERRIPSVFGFRDHVKAGGLISYSASFFAQFYRDAAYVDKILKGASPADLPIEEPTRHLVGAPGTAL